jgi:hypothetical protein
MCENNTNAQVALLLTICDYILDDESIHSSGELRMMLQDAMDLIQ